MAVSGRPGSPGSGALPVRIVRFLRRIFDGSKPAAPPDSSWQPLPADVAEWMGMDHTAAADLADARQGRTEPPQRTSPQTAHPSQAPSPLLAPNPPQTLNPQLVGRQFRMTCDGSR